MVYVMHVGERISLTGLTLPIVLPWLALFAQDTQAVPKKIAVLEQQAQQYLREQKPQLAIPVMREIISLDPKNVNANANLGVLVFFQGNYAEAIPYLRTALRIQWDLWRVEALLGIAEKRTGDPGAAQNDLERAFSNLDDKKIQIEAGLELIEIHSASGRFDKALAVASKLQELAPQNPQILLVTHDITRRILDQTLLTMMLAAPDSAEMHLMMAHELGRQGDGVNAIAQFREALRLNPKLPGAHFELAEQLRTSPDPAMNAQAEEEFRAALKLNPYDALSWRQLGSIMSAKGDFKAAEDDYNKALALRPRDGDAKTGLAIVLISTNRTNEAIALLESALKDDPANLVAHYRLSQLYRRAGRPADAERETEAFNHYKEVKDKLGKVFKQLAGTARPM